MSFDSYMLRNRPDQTVDQLNEMQELLARMQNTIRVVSKDRKFVLIIGEQPIDTSTGEPYPFGIHTYRIKGDRLEEI